MNKAKIANIDGLTKPELDYLCEHDYIKVGDKYYISKERASKLVAQLQANGAEQSDSNCNIQRISNSLLDLDGKTIPVTFHVSKFEPKIDIDLSNDC